MGFSHKCCQDLWNKERSWNCGKFARVGKGSNFLEVHKRHKKLDNKWHSKLSLKFQSFHYQFERGIPWNHFQQTLRILRFCYFLWWRYGLRLKISIVYQNRIEKVLKSMDYCQRWWKRKSIGSFEKWKRKLQGWDKE
jgi:hypothetical protein